jgi:hypothetical protein
MGRLIVELSLETGIAPSVWAAEDAETIMTALDILEERARDG